MKVMRSVGDFLRSAWQFVFCFRKVFLAIPVIVIAIILARQNAAVLPEQVGLLLSEEGTFSMLVSKQQAVYGPLLVTGVALIFKRRLQAAFRRCICETAEKIKGLV